MSYIPYGRQDVTDEDINAVIEVLRSDFLTQGPVIQSFEKALSEYCNVKNAIVFNSATSALHVACLALGVGEGDHVWTSPISFVASSNCALYCGAKVDFVDIDPKTYNLSPENLSSKLEVAQKNKCLPKVVIPVHLCGQSCEMEQIYKLSKQYGFRIIEDASHAIGGKYQDIPIGSCRFSDITIFSFHPVKIITTAEGGAALTKDSTIFQKMELLRSHGITRDESQMTHSPDGPWYYQQIDLGFNYRMNDIQAALGLSQMTRLDKYVERRHELFSRYNALLKDKPVILPWQHPESYSGMHLYVIRLKLDEIDLTHKEVFQSLRREGIGVNLHYIPIHTQPYYQKIGFSAGQYPEAEKYYSEAISLPLYQSMTDTEQDQVLSAINAII